MLFCSRQSSRSSAVARRPAERELWRTLQWALRCDYSSYDNKWGKKQFILVVCAAACAEEYAWKFTNRELESYFYPTWNVLGPEYIQEMIFKHKPSWALQTGVNEWSATFKANMVKGHLAVVPHINGPNYYFFLILFNIDIIFSKRSRID